MPVISAHALLGASGLELWISYLLLDDRRLAWAAVAALGAVAILGLIMASRSIRVYRAVPAPARRSPGRPLFPGSAPTRHLGWSGFCPPQSRVE